MTIAACNEIREGGHLHPNEDANQGQSTNDVYPAALKVASTVAGQELLQAMTYLRGAFERKAEEFAGVVKVRRPQLQDAVPMTLGQEFSTYAVMIGEDELRVSEARGTSVINLGATAIGTGITAAPGYARGCV